MEQENLKDEKVLEKEMNENQEKNNYLDTVEKMLFEEMKFYSGNNQTINAKNQRLQITDRICKLANGILATENLKERRKMNKTERMSEVRKTENSKK